MRSLLLLLACLAVAEGFVTGTLPLGRASAQRSISRPTARRSAAPVLRMASQGEWIMETDPASGAPYWYNSVTSESTWEQPFAPPAAAQADQGLVGVAAEQGEGGARFGQILAVPESQRKNAFPGGKSGLVIMMNPILPGAKWYKSPAIWGFLSLKVGIVVYALFVGFHNKYSGDFGPFLAIHDGRLDTSLASTEWARLHPGPRAGKPDASKLPEALSEAGPSLADEAQLFPVAVSGDAGRAAEI